MLGSEEDHIQNGFQRIVDFVSDGGGHFPRARQLFGLDKQSLDAFSIRDIASDFGSSNHAPGPIANWKDGIR